MSQLIDLRVQPALDALPQLAAEAAEGAGPFDFIFIDADKVNYPQYLEWAIRLSRRGTLIIIDNVVRDGEVADGASSDRVRAGGETDDVVASSTTHAWTQPQSRPSA